jgi:hypothetical protein
MVKKARGFTNAFCQSALCSPRLLCCLNLVEYKLLDAWAVQHHCIACMLWNTTLQLLQTIGKLAYVLGHVM